MVGEMPCRIGSRSADPADARSAFGPNGSAVPTPSAGQVAAPVAPNASAARKIVPTLPGSCTPTSTTSRAVPGKRFSIVACLRPHQSRDPLRRLRIRNAGKQSVRGSQNRHSRNASTGRDARKMALARFAYEQRLDGQARPKRRFHQANSFDAHNSVVATFARERGAKSLEPAVSRLVITAAFPLVACRAAEPAG